MIVSYFEHYLLAMFYLQMIGLMQLLAAANRGRKMISIDIFPASHLRDTNNLGVG